MSDTETMVIGPHAWGSGPYETKALRRMVGNLPRRVADSDTITVAVYEIDGDWQIDGMGNLTADEIVSEKRLELDGAQVRTLSDQMGEVERTAEAVLVDAEELEVEDE